AAGEHRRALEPIGELTREPALSDAGLAVDREQVCAPVTQRPFVRVHQEVELCLAADERSLYRARASTAGPLRAGGSPDPHRLRQPLQLDGTEVLDVDPAEGEPMRAGPDQELAWLGCLLETRREIDRLSGCEGRLAVLGDDLAGLDADARVELELLDRVENREPGANRALGIVLVCHRDAERGHHGVACELLDDPAVRGHAVRDAVEERLDTATHDLRIQTRYQPG